MVATINHFHYHLSMEKEVRSHIPISLPLESQGYFPTKADYNDSHRTPALTPRTQVILVHSKVWIVGLSACFSPATSSRSSNFGGLFRATLLDSTRFYDGLKTANQIRFNPSQDVQSFDR
jgi:hypothetical protein